MVKELEMKNDEIKKILMNHVKVYPKARIIKVMVERYYQIPEYCSTKGEEIVEEWFTKYSPNTSHAFRDSSLLIQKFSDVKIVSNEELKE